MRITDIIVEQGVLSQIKTGYDAGYDAVDRVMNPNRWFDNDKSKNAESEPVDKLSLRNAVNLAAAGKKIYLKDQQALKQVYAQIKSGEFETQQDSAVLLPALKTAINLKPLTPQQQQTLAAFAKEL